MGKILRLYAIFLIYGESVEIRRERDDDGFCSVENPLKSIFICFQIFSLVAVCPAARYALKKMCFKINRTTLRYDKIIMTS